MHTFEAYNGTIFNFNSDVSVDVEVIRPTPTNGLLVLRVPLADIINFVAELVRRSKVEEIEAMDDAKLLGINIEALKE